MRLGASTAGGFGLALLCGTFLFVGCGGDDSGDDSSRTGGAGGKGGTSSTGGAAGTSTTGGAGGTTGGTTGTGGSTGGTGGTPVDACAGAMTVTGGVITDMEVSAAMFTGGGYYIYSDTAGGTTTPTGATITPEAGGHVGNALHFSGTGFPSTSWGAGVGIWLTCVNASGVDGISFWMKNDVPVKVSVSQPSTQAVMYGGTCTATNCTNNAAPNVAANASWTQVDVQWSSFTGGTAPLESNHITGIDFQIPMPAGTTADWGFDVSVDDVSWLGGTTGAGGGGGAPSSGSGGAGGA